METMETTKQCETCRFSESFPEDGVVICTKGVAWKGPEDIIPDSPLPPGFGCSLHEPIPKNHDMIPKRGEELVPRSVS